MSPQLIHSSAPSWQIILLRSFVVLCVACFPLSVRTLAQPPGRPPDQALQSSGGWPGQPRPLPAPPLLMLATQKSVQADLKLNKTQAKQLLVLESKMKKAMLGAAKSGAKLQGPPPEAERQDAEKELVNILTEEQTSRIKQIAMQLQGAPALLMPEVAGPLQLTDDQKSQIQRLTRGDLKRISAILNEDQNKKWKEMTGRPFHGKLIMPPGGMPAPPK